MNGEGGFEEVPGDDDLFEGIDDAEEALANDNEDDVDDLDDEGSDDEDYEGDALEDNDVGYGGFEISGDSYNEMDELLELDDDDEYDSPVNDIEEFNFFIESIKSAIQGQSACDLYKTAISSLSQKSKDDLKHFEDYADKKAEALRKKLDEIQNSTK